MNGNDPLACLLVVDGEPDVRAATVGLLSGRGYRVLEASSCADALDHLRGRSDIALLITELTLADGDGWSLASRAVAARPDLRLIYMSGTRGSNEMGQSPYGRFLAKPCSAGRLVVAVANALAE